MVITFDLNETLLDLRGVDEVFARIFGDASVRREWFSLLIHNSLITTVMGLRSDFVSLGAASLEMVAERHGLAPGSADGKAIAEAMTSMPPHPDARPALEALSAGGMRLAVLTNSPRAAAVSQLEAAGLAGYFEEIMSVEVTGKFKPAREVYESAARRLGVSSSEMTMVAAHDWDVAGAMNAGCRGAFVRRPGTAHNPLFPKPHLSGEDLVAVAEELLARAARPGWERAP